MKKSLTTSIFLLILTMTTGFANSATKETEQPASSYGYLTIGSGPIILIPNLGVGYRIHKGNHGFDMSINASSIIVAYNLQGTLVYHFYPNPTKSGPWYIGTGIAGSLCMTENSGSAKGIAPDFVIGKEFCKKNKSPHFLEFHVQAPSWYNSSFKIWGVCSKSSKIKRTDLPMMFIKYGIGF